MNPFVFLFSDMVHTTGFDYGNLATKYPSDTYAQLKVKRQANYANLKSKLEAGNPVYLKPDRLEIDMAGSSTIQHTNIRVFGSGKATSKVYLYPFTPSVGNETVFNTRYGDTLTLTNTTFTSADKNYLFETYNCTLKPGGVANAIRIDSTPRSGFWADMVNGKSVWYGWTFSVLGETRTISSVDSGTSTIYLTSNIGAGVASNTAGKFGTEFKEEIPLADYSAYGQPWVVNYYSRKFLYAIPATATGSESDMVLNITGCGFENNYGPLTISAAKAKLNFNGNNNFTRNAIGIAFFVRSVAGGQTLTVNGGTLLIEENGDLVAGAVSGLEPSGNYGSGGYLHDSVIVKCNGILHLKNNTSASWRQYSSSYGPSVGGEFSYYQSLIAEGSIEYDFLGSNTMPTVIDYLESSGQFLMRHDVTINGGESTGLVSVSGTDFGIGPRTLTINDFSFKGTASLNGHATVNLNDCLYYINTQTTQIGLVGTVNINGGRVMNGGLVGTWNPDTGAVTGTAGGALFNNGSVTVANITVDGLVWDDYFYHSFIRMNGVQSPYLEKDQNIVINNTDVKASNTFIDNLFSTAGTVSNVVSGDNSTFLGTLNNVAARGPLMDLSGKTGTKATVLIASKTYAQVGALTNILEIDFFNDVYEVSGGGTLNAIICRLNGDSPANAMYGRNITVKAIGSPITVTVWNSGSNTTSNILTTGFTIAAGASQVFTVDRDHVFFTSPVAATPTLATGNGSTKIYKGVLGAVIDPTSTINVTAGAVNVNADANGVFNHADLQGIIDPWSGKWELRFTNNVPNLTPIVASYNNITWKNTGAWVAN